MGVLPLEEIIFSTWFPNMYICICFL